MRLGLRLRPPAPKPQFFNTFLLKIAVFSSRLALRLALRLRPTAPKFQFFNTVLLKIVGFRCGLRSASGCDLRNFNFSMNSCKNWCLSLRLGLRLLPPAPKPQFFNTFLLKIAVFSSRLALHLALRLRPTTPKLQIFNTFLLKIVVFRCGLCSTSLCEL